MTDLEGFRDCPARCRRQPIRSARCERIQRDAYGRSRADEGRTDDQAIVRVLHEQAGSGTGPYRGWATERAAPGRV
jgi:hypothetical protein